MGLENAHIAEKKITKKIRAEDCQNHREKTGVLLYTRTLVRRKPICWEADNVGGARNTISATLATGSHRKLNIPRRDQKTP